MGHIIPFDLRSASHSSYTPSMPPQGYPDDGLEEDPIYLSDSNSLWDQLRGQTTEHADPPRFEDEGQSGG
jgi:hypothetical protein